MNGHDNSKKGFSLIEVMTAMVIFIMIVLQMSQIFHESTVCWQGGERKARGGMDVRAMLGRMTREMSQAIAGPGALYAGQLEQGDSATFVTLAHDAGSGRQAQKITYCIEGKSLVSYRWNWTGSAGVNYLDADAYLNDNWSLVTKPAQPVTLSTNVSSLYFTPLPADFDSRNKLPKSTRVMIGVLRSHDISRVAARSAGPDGQFDTEDDIFCD